jgi:hypothetical protein
MADFRIDEPGTHVDHLLRQTRMHLAQLSTLADLKASVLLTTAALVVPMLLRFTEHPQWRWPSFIMIGFALATVLIAGYGTVPKIKCRRPDAEASSFDLLFFADFASVSYDEYARRMQQAIADPSRVYEMQIRSIHKQGQYLGRAKFRWIRLAYASFSLGVGLSIVAAVVVLVLGV